jgi:hypothetical protein
MLIVYNNLFGDRKMTEGENKKFPIEVTLMLNPSDLDTFLIHDGNFVIDYSEIDDKEKVLTINVIGDEDETITEIILECTFKENSSTKDKSNLLTKPQ